MPATDQPGWRELLALTAISATLLAYQIWLPRMIAIQHWHHLAALIIALALLGFGIAGVTVALCGKRARLQYRAWLQNSALLTGICLVAGVLVADRLPLNMLALPWQLHQIALLALYGLCFLPAFYCSALFVSVCFVRWPQHAGRIYAVDLLGGAFGALGILFLLDLVGLAAALWLLLLLPLLAAFALNSGQRKAIPGCFLATLLVASGLLAVHINPAEYKAASQRLLERDSQLLLEIDGLTQRLTVLQTPGMHDAPGLSLSSHYRAPAQWQLFSNADNPVPLLLTPLPGKDFYQHLLGYAPYNLLQRRSRALHLGKETLWHTWIGAAAGVELQQLSDADSDVIDLLEQLKTQQPQGIYPQGLQLRQAAERRQLAAAAPNFDLITLAVASPEAGMAATQEDYRLTLEGLDAGFARLDHGGVLAIDLQLHSMPRELLKLVATVVELLRGRRLVANDHIAIVRDWRSATLLISSSKIDSEAQAHLRSWAIAQQFDLVALPGLQAQETNRFHQFSESYFAPVRNLLDDLTPTEPGLFYLQPATDDRPFFFRFTRWQALPRWPGSFGPGWRAQLDWGYLLGIATLLAGTLLAGLLLAMPLLAVTGRNRSVDCRPPRWAKFYFAAIGTGFMFVEIGLLQQATLLLDSTTVSMATVLAALLTGAGCGSLLQHGLQPGTRTVRALLLLVALLTLALNPLLRSLFTVAADWSLAARLALVALPVLAIALPMGFALPHAIARLGNAPSATIAWVWALNGFASVLGALGASLIAVHAGFNLLMSLAAASYLLAAVTLSGSDSGARTGSLKHT